MSENGVKIVEIPSTVTVRDLAEMIDVSPIEVIKQLMANGVIDRSHQAVDGEWCDGEYQPASRFRYGGDRDR